LQLYVLCTVRHEAEEIFDTLHVRVGRDNETEEVFDTLKFTDGSDHETEEIFDTYTLQSEVIMKPKKYLILNVTVRRDHETPSHWQHGVLASTCSNGLSNFQHTITITRTYGCTLQFVLLMMGANSTRNM
jgi:hypothetical protein